ncbi:MAG: hypothetical protein CMK06_06835 [Ponticaulis sp.]|nr:hypothetical protein [Ponticaulis sp.]
MTVPMSVFETIQKTGHPRQTQDQRNPMKPRQQVATGAQAEFRLETGFLRMGLVRAKIPIFSCFNIFKAR